MTTPAALVPALVAWAATSSIEAAAAFASAATSSRRAIQPTLMEIPPGEPATLPTRGTVVALPPQAKLGRNDVACYRNAGAVICRHERRLPLPKRRRQQATDPLCCGCGQRPGPWPVNARLRRR